MTRVEPLLPLCDFGVPEVRRVRPFAVELREAPQHMGAHHRLAVLHHQHWCAAVGIRYRLGIAHAHDVGELPTSA